MPSCNVPYVCKSHGGIITEEYIYQQYVSDVVELFSTLCTCSSCKCSHDSGLWTKQSHHNSTGIYLKNFERVKFTTKHTPECWIPECYPHGNTNNRRTSSLPTEEQRFLSADDCWCFRVAGLNPLLLFSKNSCAEWRRWQYSIPLDGVRVLLCDLTLSFVWVSTREPSPWNDGTGTHNKYLYCKRIPRQLAPPDGGIW